MNVDQWNGYTRENLPVLFDSLESVQQALDGRYKVEELYESFQQHSVLWNGLTINMDVYESKPDDPVLIFFTGIANYARFYFVFLSLLSKEGFNVVAVDRPGHGFSAGKRGDCTVDDVRTMIPNVIDWASKRYNDRIGLFGTSLGGITTFYLLPDVEGIKSALCHNWLYPGELADEKKRLLSHILKLANRFVPKATLPIRKLVDPAKVPELSASDKLVDYFINIANDPIYCQGLTLRSVVSYFGGHQPLNSYADVKIPVLGLISEYEKVLPFETSKSWWKRAGFKEDAIRVIPKAKHMIFHDRIAEATSIVAQWFAETL